MFTLTLTKCKTGKVYELPLAEGVSITYSEKSSSSTTFEKLRLSVAIEVGDIVMLSSGDTLIWKGIVFTDSQTIKACDLIRYLKNPDVVTFEDITLSKLVQEACQACNIDYISSTTTNYKHELVELDNTEYLTSISDLQDEEFVRTGVEYVLQGHKGFVTLLNQNKCIYNRELSIQQYNISKSIDTNCHNQIIVYNKDKTEFAVSQNLQSVRTYGLLRTIIVADVNEDLQLYANQYLDIRNTIKVDLNLTVFGGVELLEITNGYIIPVTIKDDNIDINQYFIVDNVTHKLTNTGIETTLKVRNYTEEMG